MREVSIVGVGSTRFGRHGETAIDDLAASAARDALADAGVEPERIGALYLGISWCAVAAGRFDGLIRRRCECEPSFRPQRERTWAAVER